MGGLKLVRERLAVAVVVILKLLPKCIATANICPVGIGWAHDIEVDLEYLRQCLKSQEKGLGKRIEPKDTQSMELEGFSNGLWVERRQELGLKGGKDLS